MVQRWNSWFGTIFQRTTFSPKASSRDTMILPAVTALPADNEVAAPPTPTGLQFYGRPVDDARYRLHVSAGLDREGGIWGRFGWAITVNGKRVLCLFALPVPGLYSTPAMRIAETDQEKRRNHILRAACYLLRVRPESQRATLTLPVDPRQTRSYSIPGRYQYTGDGNSFANIFINDVTRVLHCELPNNPDRTLVRDMYDWLASDGITPTYGWQALADGQAAQRAADEGRVVVMFRIADVRDERRRMVFDDHVALVVPTGDTPVKVVAGVTWPRVAQAGRVCGTQVESFSTFSEDASRLRFFSHA